MCRKKDFELENSNYMWFQPPPPPPCRYMASVWRDKNKIQFLKYVEEERLLDQEQNEDIKDRLNIREKNRT